MVVVGSSPRGEGKKGAVYVLAVSSSATALSNFLLNLAHLLNSS